MPNDPRREELDGLEVLKAQIDRKAEALVRFELYSGLGFLVLQTLGFMRLTFWELSWDVMEPICFFVTSFHFAMAYLFFMRTSTEPSFVGYFQRRFKVKQKKLMRIHSFDMERYNHLRRVFYPGKSFIDSRDMVTGTFLDHVPNHAWLITEMHATVFLDHHVPIVIRGCRVYRDLFGVLILYRRLCVNV